MASNIDDTQPLEGDTETLNTRNNFVEAKAEITALQNKDTTQDADIAGKEPVITPKNSAFNVNFGTGNGNASRGDHLHSGIYEPVINPKNSGFNLVLGDTAGKVAEGDHNHNTDYEPKNANIQVHVTSPHAPSDAEQNVNADWNSGVGDSQILNKPATMPPSAHTHPESEINGLDKYTQTEVDTNIGVVQTDLDNHKDHDNLHMTADERAAMDTTVANNAPDALNPFITQDDLVAGAHGLGHEIQEDAVSVTQRLKLNFEGDVALSDNGSDTTTVTITGGGGGEANTTSNSGAGSGLAQSKNGVDLPFKSLIGGENIILSEQADTITITGEAGGAGGQVDSVIAGTNITVTGTAIDPIVNGLPLGTGAGQAAEGNHDHTGIYEPADATIMKEGENISLLNNNSNYAPDQDLSGLVPKNSQQALADVGNALTIAGNTITLARGDASTDTVTISDGVTDLDYTASPANGIVTSSTGDNATVPLANGTNAGLITPEEKTGIVNAISNDVSSIAALSGIIVTKITHAISLSRTEYNKIVHDAETAKIQFTIDGA